MTTLAKGFDRLAPIYDSLARLVIGREIRTSQLYFLNHLEQKQKLLILGGGTGWILPLIIERNPRLFIDYVELSSKMLSKSELTVRGNQNIRFIEGTEESILNGKYDCVITNFYLDLFNNHQLESVIERLKKNLRPNACWIATDFVSEKKWHSAMLWIMYRFFFFTTGLKTKSLPEWENELINTGGKLIARRVSSRGFIKSVVFEF